jgi:hypothetical protein
MNVLVQQSFENVVVGGGGVPSLITTQSFTVTPEDPLDGLTIAQTFYAKITYPYFRIVLINTAEETGNVYLTTKLAASATSSGGGVANLNPTDDGVKVYGSSNGTTPIVLKTDVTGKLEVEIVGPPSLVTIKGSEDLVFAQDSTSGIMYVTDQVGGLALESTLANIYSSTIRNTYNTTQVIDPFTVTGTFPLVIGAAGVIPNTTVDLYKIQPFDPADEAFYYNSVSVLGTISGITNINTPQICFQYSNDNVLWFGDGLYPTLLLVSGTTYSFAFQRTGMPARYVRLFAMTGLNVGSLVMNRIHL